MASRKIFPLVVLCWALALAAPFAISAQQGEQPAAAPPEAPVLEDDSDVEPPHVILKTQKAPEYPPAALAGRFNGTVKVEVKVLADGTVGEARAIECDRPNLGFEAASVAAVKQWRFEPASREGVPIDYVTTFRLNFRASGVGAGREGYVSAGAATDVSRAPDRPAPSTSSGRKP